MFTQTFTNGTRNEPLNIAIVGGGLVGSLAALHLGRKGHTIDLYEYREDIRKAELVVGRSINLALSARGRKALAEVGLEKELLQHGIPMRGRMLHDLKGNRTIIPYDKNTNQCIYSVGRKHINEILLSAADKYPNIRLNFNQKLVNAKLDDGELEFLNPITKEKLEKKVDLIIGCDGAYSSVRKHMLQRPGFDFSQTYIEHGYMELCIPSKNNDYAMPHNYLHIWPRGKFMMIALPNQDKTWTVTLFMPFENFANIQTLADLLDFFSTYFPDSIPLIGEKKLVQDFFNAKPQHLISIKCKPYNISSKVLLLGDAAHAMVPFYAQGMNSGFEDCTILSEIMNNYNTVDIAQCLHEFSQSRWENAHAMCDLAMYNYIEMRDLVTRKSYRLRKELDDTLFYLFPSKWIPLYNSVSFSHMPYKKCIENRKWQDKILTKTITAATIIVLIGFSTMGYVYTKRNNILNINNFINYLQKYF